MLWLGLRNQRLQSYPDGDRVERVHNRVLCLGLDGLILASFPFDEVLVYTKNADVAERLRQGLDETARSESSQGIKMH